MAAFHNFCLICYQQFCGEKRKGSKREKIKTPESSGSTSLPRAAIGKKIDRDRGFTRSRVVIVFIPPQQKKSFREPKKQKKKANKKLEECRIVRPKSYTPLQKDLVFDRALPFLVVHA